jgi:hypothetical protein
MNTDRSESMTVGLKGRNLTITDQCRIGWERLRGKALIRVNLCNSWSSPSETFGLMVLMTPVLELDAHDQQLPATDIFQRVRRQRLQPRNLR